MYYISQVDRLSQSVETSNSFNELPLKDIAQHLQILRNGGEINTQYGLKWTKEATDNTLILDAINIVDKSFVKEDYSEFKTAYLSLSSTLSSELLATLKKLRIIKLIIFSVFFLCFFACLIWLYLRLKKADESALKVGSENAQILSATYEGLFLIDSDFEIGVQKSDALTTIFGNADIVSGNFIELLSNHVDDHNLSLAKAFIQLLFEGRVLPDLIQDVNPLQEVEMDVVTRAGSSDRKILNFKFARGNAKESVDTILVSVSDVTKEVILRRELDATKSLQKERMNMFMGLLHISPDQLIKYCDSSHQQMTEINNILADDDLQQSTLKQKLDDIFIKAHRIKGDSAALGLTLFEQSMHQFEDEVERLKKMPVLDGRNILSLTVQLKEMITETEVVRALVPQFKALMTDKSEDNDTLETTTLSDNSAAILELNKEENNSLTILASEISKGQSKSVKLDINGFEILKNKPELLKSVNEMCAEFIKNSITHGLETPEQRLAQNKTSFGVISVMLSGAEDNSLKLEVRDDGQGLQFDRIKQQAIDNSLVSTEDALSLKNNALLKFIFMPNFSSAEVSDLGEESGMGLHYVLNKIQSLGGRISVSSSANKFCKFTVNIPLDKN